VAADFWRSLLFMVRFVMELRFTIEVIATTQIRL